MILAKGAVAASMKLHETLLQSNPQVSDVFL